MPQWQQQEGRPNRGKLPVEEKIDPRSVAGDTAALWEGEKKKKKKA